MRTLFARVLRVLFVVFVLCVVLVVFVAIGLLRPSPPIVVSKETTHLTEPLGDDGLPDYAQVVLAQQREGVTQENNGAIPFWQAMWPGEFTPKERGIVLRELEFAEPPAELIDPFSDKGIRPELVYLCLKKEGHEALADEYLERKKAEGDEPAFSFFYREPPIEKCERNVDELFDEVAQPWTAAQLPPLAEWLNENQHVFDLLAEAANRPKFYSPSPLLLEGKDEPLMTAILPEIHGIQLALRLLQARALLRIANGEYEGAWNDLLVGYRLSDHFSGQHTSLHELISISGKGKMDDATLHLLERADLPAELAMQIFGELQARQPRNEMANISNRGERLMFVDAILRYSNGTVEYPPASDIRHIFRLASIDWNVVLRDGNAWFDRIIETRELKDWGMRHVAIEEIWDDPMTPRYPRTRMFAGIFNREIRSRILGESLFGWLLPAITANFAAEDRDNIRLQLMQLAAALAVYRTANGEYPDSLDALVPGVLQELPVDLFDEKPFVYERIRDGYLLYSLGPNGRDDFGCNSERNILIYRGYRYRDTDDRIISQLLIEWPLLREGQKTWGDDASDKDKEAQSDSDRLFNLMPVGADDRSLRLPQLYTPLPVLTE